MNDITWAGVLTTATNVLFSGGKEGYFLALDARTGELLWKAALGGQINSGPMSYSVNGRQFITVAAGNSLFAYALRPYEDVEADLQVRNVEADFQVRNVEADLQVRLQTLKPEGTIMTKSSTVIAIVTSMLLPAALLAQTPDRGADRSTAQSANKGKPWSPPRTAEGRPNFEGDWVNNTFTPLERPDDLGDKAFFTPDEAKAYAERNIARQKAQSQDNIHYDDFIWMNEGTLRSVTSSRTSIVVEPSNGKIPRVNAVGQQRAQARAAARKLQGDASDRVQNRALSERCIIWGHEGPPMLPVGYNANIKIVQSPDYIVIIQEMTHNTRVIPLVEKPPLGAGFRHWSGESRGWWDGDTLVVVTTNYNDKVAWRGASENLKVTERFRLADAGTIGYEFTVDDPATWDTPWKGEIAIRKADGEIWEYACHEGNYGVRNILNAARVADAQADAAKNTVKSASQ